MNKRESQRPPVGLPSEYGELLADIKARVRSAQLAAFRAVNKELVALYWDIGKMIDGRQLAGSRGDMVVKKLAEDLQSEFPGVAGFSWRNLFYMSEFYVAYRDQPKLQPLVAIIGWTHNLIILQRCSDPLEREFYIRMTRKFGWSKNVLIHQIENQTYEKTLLNQTNFDEAVTPAIRAQAKLAVKDEYLFDFLELGEEHAERELERALISRIEDFLRAMGGLYGGKLLQHLAGRLTAEFGDGYSIHQLKFMRRFYREYPQLLGAAGIGYAARIQSLAAGAPASTEILHTLRGESEAAPIARENLTRETEVDRRQRGGPPEHRRARSFSGDH